MKYLRLKVWTFCAFNLFQKNNRKRDKIMNDDFIKYLLEMLKDFFRRILLSKNEVDKNKTII